MPWPASHFDQKNRHIALEDYAWIWISCEISLAFSHLHSLSSYFPMSIKISTCAPFVQYNALLFDSCWQTLIFSCRQQLSFIMTSSLKPPTVQIHISFPYLGASVIGFEFACVHVSILICFGMFCYSFWLSQSLLNRYICLTNLCPLFSLCIQHLTVPLYWYMSPLATY